MNIVCVKFFSGEEVMSTRKEASSVFTELGVHNTPKAITYSNLRVVMLHPNPSGEGVSVSMIPYVLLNPSIELTEAQWSRLVSLELGTSPELEKIYLQNTSRIKII